MAQGGGEMTIRQSLFNAFCLVASVIVFPFILAALVIVEVIDWGMAKWTMTKGSAR
jgi:hypothetical protein